MEQPRAPGVHAMRHTTGIQWTHVEGYVGATWNPTVGCSRVSPGCDNCYAFQLHDQRYASNLRVAREAIQQFPAVDAGWRTGTALIELVRARLSQVPLLAPQYDRPFSQVQMLDEKRLTAPLRTRKPHAYFVDSMADLFHEDVSRDFLDVVFGVMALSPQHIFMVLTKRPAWMRAYMLSSADAVEGTYDALAAERGWHGAPFAWPLPNVWLGVSAEDQQRADERIPLLLDTPAAMRFVSAEPLLGPIKFHNSQRSWLRPWRPETLLPAVGYEGDRKPWVPALDWLIIGGESGARARPFDFAWARDIVAQCRFAGVAPFVKQLGAVPIGRWSADLHVGDESIHFRLRNRHGSDVAEWPEDLRVREFPR